MGNAYKNLGKSEDAISYYERAIELEPASAQIYHNLALTYKDIGEIEQAIAFYKKAITRDLTYAKAYYNLALAYFHNNQ